MLDRVSSFSGSILGGYQSNTMQTQLNQLTAEVSSGQKTNPAASLGAQAAVLYQLQSQSDEQTELQTSLTTASSRLDTVQTALTSLASVAQTMTTAAQGTSTTSASGLPAVGSQATSAIQQVLALLNTSYLGSGVFAGDAGAQPPMTDASGTSGISTITQNVLNQAVSANGGPLTASDIDNLLNGPNGLSSVFNDTNSDPTQTYGGGIYTGSTDGKPTKVEVAPGQTVSYDASANQPAFRDLLKGLSMLSMLSAPSSQLDDSAKTQLLSQASTVLTQAQNELTQVQGSLGAVQSTLSTASNAQQSAATNTQTQIQSLVQTNTDADSSQISMLQTQLQASYTLTSQISQLSLVHFMPTA
jgi:flagellar hook-associated protein 3 FlgL